jgi:hypothetical protein
MSCNDILPEISIDGISVRQLTEGAATDAPVAAGSFSTAADEEFELTISHTNLIEVENFLDSFSLRDILDATSGQPDLYNVKVLVTNDPDRYELIKELVAVAEQVGFYLYNGTQTPTTQEVKKFIDATPADAPEPAKQAVQQLNKCIFKMASTPTAAVNQTVEEEPAPGVIETETTTEQTSPTPSQVKQIVTLADRILAALNDNNYVGLDPTEDQIFTFAKPLQVSSEQIEISGNPPAPKIINSQKLQVIFGDTQLKNLYAVLVPNVEFRENEKLIFTVRQYVSLPLVENFQPQNIGVDKIVDVSLAEQKPQFALDKFTLGGINELVRKAFGDNGYYSFTQNTGNEKVISDPVVSIGYGQEVNGVFFLSQKNLSKNLISYQAFLDNPELYKDVLQGVKMSKVFDDGTIEELADPATLTGLSFNGGMTVGYKFTDVYDPREFHYRVTVTAKSPLQSLFDYVLPLIGLLKYALDGIVSSFETGKKSLIIFNPITGYFTDDYINSEFYTNDNQLYGKLRTSLFKVYNFLLPNKQITIEDRKLVSFDQFQELQELYNQAQTTLLKIAETEGINIPNQSATSSNKSKKKDFEPYKTFNFVFEKGYTYREARVFYDFINQTEPTESGFFVNPQTLSSRVDLEGQTLDSYGVTEESNAYADDEVLSFAPVSVKIDDTMINLVTDVEDFEKLYTDTLLAAELEVKAPYNFYTTRSDLVGKLLEADGVTIEVPGQKTLTALPPQDNFIPSDLDNSRQPLAGKKITKKVSVIEQTLKAILQAAVEQLGQQATKSLYLDQATYPNAFVQTAVFLKVISKIDQKHGKVAQLLGEPEYKLRPASFITRLMNSYQLEYVSGLNSKFEPVYTPLTKQFFTQLPAESNVVARVVLKAGIPILSEYNITNEHFIISNSVNALPVPSPFAFLSEAPELLTAEQAQTLIGFQGISLPSRSAVNPSKARSTRAVSIGARE